MGTKRCGTKKIPKRHQQKVSRLKSKSAKRRVR